MPSISKIRFTNVVYEDGMKRYNDETFKFDGFNGAILLENGGGKTVFIQTALQAIIPHTSLADRKVKQTLQLDSYPAHVAIEWILSDNPRRYLVTCVSLFLTKNGLDSYRYVYEYEAGNKHSIEEIPFVKTDYNRPADRGEISEYYQQMAQQYPMNAQTFQTIKAFQAHIEDEYHIIANEWESIVKINSTEGGVEAFFDECKQTNQLFDRLLIPTVEDAISGHEKNTFADTFEKHRSSFKLYKELKGQIEENKAIEAELNHYVKTYEGLHAEQQFYQQNKQQAKAVLNLINTQEQEQQTLLKNTVEKMLQWEKDNKQLELKQASYNIQLEKNHLEAVNEQFREIAQSLEATRERLAEARTTYYSLKLADLKKTYKEEEDRVSYYQDKLGTIDEEEDLSDIQNQLDANSEALMGYFSHEFEQIKKTKQAFQIERQPIMDQLEQAASDRKEEKERFDTIKGNYHTNTGLLESKQENLERIRNLILSNPDQESVSENLSNWQKRLQELDEQVVKLTENNKLLFNEMQDNRKKVVTISQEKDEKEMERAKKESELKQIEQAHDKVKDTLATLRSPWAHIESIYLKQDSIQQQLLENLQRLKKEREQRLHNERLVHRFVDDYGEQDLFFADPFVEKQIRQWANQFDFLETGVQYIQSLNHGLKERIKDYPLWPVTLITTEKEQALLQQKVLHINDHLQFPIDILTTEEARVIIQEGKLPSNSIVPSHWTANQNASDFLDWKGVIKDRAQEATTVRQEIETEIRLWERANDQLVSFLQDHPYASFQDLKEHHTQLVQSVQKLRADQQRIERQNNEWEEKLNSQRERISDYEKEYNGLGQKLEKALQYMQYKKEVSELTSQQEQLTIQMNQFQKAIVRVENRIDRLKEDKVALENEIKAQESYYNQLIDDAIYQEVKSYQPTYTDKAKQVLLDQRKEIGLAFHSISTSRREIVAKLESAQDKIKSAERQIRDLKREQGSLDETVAFPPNGKERMSTLLTDIENLKERERESSSKHERVKTKRDKQDQKVESMDEKIRADFPNQQIESFTESLEIVKQHLAERSKLLSEQETYLAREQQRMERELKTIEEAFRQLDRFDEAHHFKGPSVSALVLSQEDIQTFTYGRVDFVKKVTTSLTSSKQKVADEWERVEKAKDAFKGFCKRKVTNVKMREMAIQGIDSKQTYGDVIEFQTNMQKSIQTAIRYNEASIINHDQQLEQFVTHMHSHLRTIAQELELIPKKTRVKVEDKWKEIYKFSIPQWEDEAGKGRLRDHIEWILEQLETDKYLDIEGREDYGKVRKEIETWLQSKQLLRIVMNNETMKVTCRKVTNDNQVTTRSYSWEQTNVWSGGEKWSKNMTLFLGILNYVAEKQKHIQPNMKRHRAVIMDNPFGKASSDHVLNPVFFIAEQLGFQIIALTAHAEGKFLRDYFPVIYSCRLRPAADSNKQIMTKEKQLHQAYFQDHEPQALERLGEVEQMELF